MDFVSLGNVYLRRLCFFYLDFFNILSSLVGLRIFSVYYQRYPVQVRYDFLQNNFICYEDNIPIKYL